MPDKNAERIDADTLRELIYAHRPLAAGAFFARFRRLEIKTAVRSCRKISLEHPELPN